MTRFNAETPPFWERRRGGGPVTDWLWSQRRGRLRTEVEALTRLVSGLEATAEVERSAVCGRCSAATAQRLLAARQHLAAARKSLKRLEAKRC